MTGPGAAFAGLPTFFLNPTPLLFQDLPGPSLGADLFYSYFRSSFSIFLCWRIPVVHGSSERTNHSQLTRDCLCSLLSWKHPGHVCSRGPHVSSTCLPHVLLSPLFPAFQGTPSGLLSSLHSFSSAASNQYVITHRIDNYQEPLFHLWLISLFFFESACHIVLLSSVPLQYLQSL